MRILFIARNSKKINLLIYSTSSSAGSTKDRSASAERREDDATISTSQPIIVSLVFIDKNTRLPVNG